MIHLQERLIFVLELRQAKQLADELDSKTLPYRVEQGKIRYDFYSGITNNPKTRKQQHENEDGFKIDVWYDIDCETYDVAAKVEERMEELGYDCGDQLGNGKKIDDGEGDGESKYAYVYLKKETNKKS